MKNIFCLVATTVVCLDLVSAHAQPAPYAGGGPNRAALDWRTTKLFGDNSAFSATLENSVKVNNGEQTMTMPGKLAFDSGKSRFEMDLSQAKGPQMRPEIAEQMKTMGMDKTISIQRPDKKVAYVVYPGLQAYAETPLKEADASKPDSASKIKTTELGKETVDGHPCVKNKTTVTDDQGAEHEFTVWNATDLKKFPIRIETTEQGTAITMSFRDVKFSKPDAALFDPPADYKKYDNTQTMMQTEMMKRMGGMGGMGGVPPLK